jgi:hypothetical protein
MEVQNIETDSMSHRRNANRVAKDEAELAELLKQVRGESDETPQEETVEAESSSQEPESESVQAEGDTKQKEEPKAEASKEDDADLSAEEKTFKQRYADIQRHMQKTADQHKEEIEKLKGQLEAATKNELVLPKSDEEIEAWAKQYPDVAGIVEAIAAKEANKKATSLDARLAEIEELRATAKREKAEVELAKMHPDFNEIREDDAFHTWAEDQPKWVQDALYENTDDAKSVARVIDLYKVDKGITTKKANSADKDAASSVKTKRTSTPDPDDTSKYISESQVAKMSIKEYEQRQDEIMEAQRSGKFIYDLRKK